MKVGVFFHDYQQVHERKDPGQIVLGLGDLGLRCEMITIDRPSVKGLGGSIPLRLLTQTDASDPGFWRGTDYDMVLAYNWLRPDFEWIVTVLSQAGKRVVVKGDTDGRLVYPLHPRWDTFIGPMPKLEFMKIARRRFLRRIRSCTQAEVLKRHIGNSDGVIVETPQAFANLSYLLTYWGVPQLVEKLFLVPNPVGDDVARAPLPAKKPQIAAVGNWGMKFGYYYAKNTPALVDALTRFLEIRQHYSAVIMGGGEDVVLRLRDKTSIRSSEAMKITGPVNHASVIEHLGEARTFFMPSVSEGMSIAASESLCMGCSFVATPLESASYLSGGGRYGVVASDFSVSALVGALIADSERWRLEEYSSDRIAGFWRSELNRRAIAERLLSVFEQVISK